jgi:hypothetical protein
MFLRPEGSAVMPRSELAFLHVSVTAPCTQILVQQEIATTEQHLTHFTGGFVLHLFSLRSRPFPLTGGFVLHLFLHEIDCISGRPTFSDPSCHNSRRRHCYSISMRQMPPTLAVSWAICSRSRYPVDDLSSRSFLLATGDYIDPSGGAVVPRIVRASGRVRRPRHNHHRPLNRTSFEVPNARIPADGDRHLRRGL